MENFKIIKQNSLGDGVAFFNNKQVYIPYTIIGDEVEAEIIVEKNDSYQAKLLRVVKKSDNRTNPKCQHFGVCGGCQLQHFSNQYYQDFKTNIVKDILARLDVEDNVLQPLIFIGEKQRRRVELKLQKIKDKVKVGFFSPKSHDVVDLNECWVIDEVIFQFMQEFKLLLPKLADSGSISSIYVTKLDNGLDISLKLKKPFRNKDRDVFQNFATDKKLCRVSYSLQDKEYEQHLIYDSGSSIINISNIDIKFPEGGFLQASKKAQYHITSIIEKHLQGCENVADLYAGCGTYSVALLNKVNHIYAYEIAQDMVTALHNAVSGQINAEVRDLYRSPLKAEELASFEAVIINPPRDGAKAQSIELARSSVRKIVMVSCNPKTFARDSKILISAGYQLLEITPIDQFYWSKHLEIVAVFVRS